MDENLKEVAPGAEGELLMTGPQVTLGYWRDPEKTAAAFLIPPGKDRVHYRTGDRVCRPVMEEPLVYLGRRDHQIKVLGHRVELGEVEAVLRSEAGVEAAVALGWPITPAGAGGIVAFVADRRIMTEAIRDKTEAIRHKLKTKLPPYAVPREIRLLRTLPLNANGKVDRRALLKMLEEAV